MSLQFYKPLETAYSTDKMPFVPFYCGATMLKFPWQIKPHKTCAARMTVHPDLDIKELPW